MYAGDHVVDCAFMGTAPNSPDNRWLRDLMQQQIPVIYFLGASPGRYRIIIPMFIVGWHPKRLRVDLSIRVIVGASAQATLPASLGRPLRPARGQRQVAPTIISRCRPEHLRRLLCNLASARTRLLEAAHTVMDAEDRLSRTDCPSPRSTMQPSILT
jgi:putative restriction endonuclease